MHRIKLISLIALVLLIAVPTGTVYSAGHGALETTAGDLEAQLGVAITHANLAKGQTTIEGVYQHLEHVVNAIEGSDGANYGDVNGDGTTEDFGDGVGVLGYATMLGDLADATAAVLPVDAEFAVTTTAISTAAANAATKAGSARDIALNIILNISSLSLANTFLGPGGNTIISDLNAALNGSVALGDGAVQASASVQDLDIYLATLEVVPDLPDLEVAEPVETPTPTPIPPESIGEPAIPMLAQAALIGSVLLIAAGGLLVIRTRRSRVRS